MGTLPPAPHDWDFLPVMARSHGCSFTAPRKLCQEEHRVHLQTHTTVHREAQDCPCHQPGQEPSTPTPSTAMTASGTSTLLLFLAELQPSAVRIWVFLPKKQKQFSVTTTFSKIDTPHHPLLHPYPRDPFVQRYSQFVDPILLAFMQMGSIKTHTFHFPCSWKSHRANNLNKLLPSKQ